MSTRRLCLNVTLFAEEGCTLLKQIFRTWDDGRLELWLDREQRVHEFSLSPAGMDTPAPELPAEERRRGTRRCPECSASLHPGDLYCTECGIRIRAPACPACRRPVALPAADGSAGGGQGAGLPWHIGWSGRCGQCDHLFAASRRVGAVPSPLTQTETGQMPPNPVDTVDRAGDAGTESLLQVTGAETVRVDGERREYQPVIRIRINRLLSGKAVGASEALSVEEQLSLTVAECRALLGQLQGPLSVLMERESWIESARDTRD